MRNDLPIIGLVKLVAFVSRYKVSAGTNEKLAAFRCRFQMFVIGVIDVIDVISSCKYVWTVFDAIVVLAGPSDIWRLLRGKSLFRLL